jgi:hypothetical protein
LTSQPRDVLHHEHLRLEAGQQPDELAEKLVARVVDLPLAGDAEALARRRTVQDVQFAGLQARVGG